LLKMQYFAAWNCICAVTAEARRRLVQKLLYSVPDIL
jgi:hypothetical protein